MAHILAVGNATLDIINMVDSYPLEDQEVRALSQHRNRGGNATNTLVVLHQLGHECSWAGTLASEPDAELIRADLQEHNIDTSAVYTAPHGKVPTSYIALSHQSGSRTIVHYRDLAEYTFDDFSRIDLSAMQWLHFEGRNITEVARMMLHARAKKPDLTISLEAEKPRNGIDQLYPYADLIMFSRDFAQHHGHEDAPAFLSAMHHAGMRANLTCTWGEKGAHAINHHGELFSTPAFSPAKVVDTLGAGDVFNAGLIDQLVREQPLENALNAASQLAGKKCGVYGLTGFIG